VDWLLDVAVICSRKGSLHMIELSSGKSQLLTTLADEIFSSPVVCDGRLVVGCRDNYVHCFDIVREIANS